MYLLSAINLNETYNIIYEILWGFLPSPVWSYLIFCIDDEHIELKVQIDIYTEKSTTADRYLYSLTNSQYIYIYIIYTLIHTYKKYSTHS